MRSSNGNSTGASAAIQYTACKGAGGYAAGATATLVVAVSRAWRHLFASTVGEGVDRYEIARRPTRYSVIARGWAGRIAAAAVVLALIAGPAAACSVCQGDPDSRMAKGAQAGVVALLAITYGLLAGIATIAGVWVVRARRMRVDETPGAPGNDRHS